MEQSGRTSQDSLPSESDGDALYQRLKARLAEWDNLSEEEKERRRQELRKLEIPMRTSLRFVVRPKRPSPPSR